MLGSTLWAASHPVAGWGWAVIKSQLGETVGDCSGSLIIQSVKHKLQAWPISWRRGSLDPGRSTLLPSPWKHPWCVLKPSHHLSHHARWGTTGTEVQLREKRQFRGASFPTVDNGNTRQAFKRWWALRSGDILRDRKGAFFYSSSNPPISRTKWSNMFKNEKKYSLFKREDNGQMSLLFCGNVSW